MAETKKLSTVGVILAIVAIAIWAGNFIISRGLGGMYSPAVTAFSRWLLACVFLFPFAIKHVKAEWKYIVEQKWVIILSGLSGIGIYSLLCYTAGQTTTATNMSLLATSSPIFTIIIMRVLFKEKITSQKVIGIILAIIGVVLLVIKGDINVLMNLDFTKGDILIILATFIWSIYTILNKFKKPTVSTWSFIFCSFVVALIVITPFFIGDMIINGFPHLEKIGISCFLYLAIGPSIVSFMLWNKAVIILGATNSSIIYNTIPIFSCILAFFILGEPIKAIQVVSMIVIFIGVGIAQDSLKFGSGKKKELKEADQYIEAEYSNEQ